MVKALSWKTILANMIKACRGYSMDASNRITDFNVGQPQHALLQAVAMELSRIWYNLKRVYRDSRLLTAVGEELDKKATACGVLRRQATKSSVIIRWYGSEGSTVPSGSRAATALGVSFVTLVEDSVGVGDAYVDIAAEADEAGMSGNVRQNTIVVMIDAPSGFTSVTNPASATGGLDQESDDHLRSRSLSRYAYNSNGIQDSYKAWAQEADESVLRAKVEKTDDLGALKLYVVKNTGADYSAGSLTTIEEYVEVKCPIHAVPTCSNITWTTVDIAYTIKLEPGYDITTVNGYITTALQKYINFEVWGWGTDVQRSDLIALINNTEGVNDVNSSTFVPVSDVLVSEYSLPKLGTITGSEGEF